MTVEELKQALLGKAYPESVQISEDQVVVDIPLFLRIQFVELDSWQRDIVKCPAFLRLTRFKEALGI